MLMIPDGALDSRTISLGSTIGGAAQPTVPVIRCFRRVTIKRLFSERLFSTTVLAS